MNRFILGLGAGLGAMRLPALAGGSAAATGRVAVTLALAGGTVAYVRSFPPAVPKKDPADSRLVLDRSLMEAVCGAVGEVAQVVALYPLESIKVRCQAEGVGAAAALRTVMAGGPASALRALYSGIGAAAICSVIVGAVHYASFCMSKRAAMAATNGGGGGGGGGEPSTGPATAVAAVVGAVSTALVESPCDLYRHLAQAGMVQGNFLAEMASAVRRDGVGALYWGFFSFCMESLPYDVVELGTYGSLGDARDAAIRRGDPLGKRLEAIPSQVIDMAIGAAAGAAAVTISMPFDVIKTYLQTHGAEVMAAHAGRGVLGEAAAFAAVGRSLVAKRGPGALFVGMAPRLVQQVPSSTICWAVIEQCRSALEPYTKP